jgi:hypothetical protein
MTDFIKNKLKLFICFSLIVLLLGACTSNYSIKKFFRSPEKRTLNLYTNYIKNISSAEFPLSSFKSNSKLCNQSIYAKKLLSNSNLQFFPATLWQVYALNSEPEWKEYAEDYSAVLYEEKISGQIKNGEIIQDVYLTPFLVTGENNYNSSLLKIVAA